MILCSQSYYEVTRLSFNTRSKELAPAFYKNSLVFCSDRRNDLLTSYIDLDNNPFTNLYVAEQRKPGQFEKPRLMAKELTSFLFEGPSTFSRDGKTIYFTRTIDVTKNRLNSQRKDTTFGIFSAEFTNGQWASLNQFFFNSPAYNTGYPFLSDDGKQLYFCSTAPEGFGGYDIYVSNLENGRWGKPVNLGANVNTSGNEVFPFLHHDGKLYFASRGHNQRGDLDIYYTMNIDGTWQKPVPLPEPFNSTRDDYGLILNASSDTGYFVSDRAGSADIYAVYSTLPTFTQCPDQQENDYCYVFYEPNNNEVDTTAFAYEWDLGDGTKIRSLRAEHCFAEPGTYLVQLNIVDKLTKDVLISQASETFVVEKIVQPYIQAPDTVMVDEEISLNGRESFLKDFTISNYYWDFDDGFRASGIDTKHRYIFPGTYQLRLGVTGQNINSEKTDQKSCVTRRIIVVGAKK
jgi:Tol biopolymer transport system component